MGKRFRDWWDRHWLPAIVVLVALPTAFLGAGLAWGHEVTVLQVCGGPGNQECPPERFTELNVLAGWVAAAVVAVALAVLGVVARRLDR